MDFWDTLFKPRLILPLAYYAYRSGEYIPDETRPVITIKGGRKWYAPWLRYPDEVLLGMSEAMAFRAQDAILANPEKQHDH